MSRKDTVNSLFFNKLGAPNPAAGAERNPERVRSGAVSAMGASLQEMSENAKVASRLQEQLAAGNVVIELDPDQIIDSSVSDRIAIENDPVFDELVASIAKHGQQVPILVRPASGERQDRYQIAYGRRRLRAVAKLGHKVKAIVRSLTDDELVIAQGKENLDRQDLSFVEKALFAWRLEEAGYQRDIICAALSTEKADLSRYISVARRIPEDIIRAIGPAPRAGRARWLALADRAESAGAKMRKAIADQSFPSLASDERLQKVLASVAEKKARPPAPQVWKDPRGRKAAQIEQSGKTTRIVFDERIVPDFASYLTSRLGELFEEFERKDR